MLNSINKISRGNLANLKELLSISQSKIFLANKINFTKNIVIKSIRFFHLFNIQFPIKYINFLIYIFIRIFLKLRL